jgi:outer membrane protein
MASVSAETLKEALTAAYLFNPTLKAARAQLRAIDENVPRAKSGQRPRIDAFADQRFQDTAVRTRRGGADADGFVPILPDANPASAPTSTIPLNSFTGAGVGGRSGSTEWPRSYSLQLQQNIFDGFQTRNAVSGAKALVEAGREDLRSTEQQILLDATTAFMDVVRDQAILELRENNVKVLSEQLRATEDRFQVGEVTRTDVAQARARLSSARSELSAARANLQVSRANYQRLIGNPPSNLRAPTLPGKLIPASLEEAIVTGERLNPTILASIFRERAALHEIKQIKGELLPRVDLQATYTNSFNTSATTREIDDTTVVASVSVPLYEGGEVYARARQAQQTRSQRLQQIDEAREQVRANVISAWGQVLATRAQIVSDQASVEANRIALEGVREEERVGQRTVLDVLDAEQFFLNSQVALVTSRRDSVVASFQLLTAIGRLTAYDISLQAELYDPAAHYSEVKDKWIGWSTSVEAAEDPDVAPVVDPGLVPGQDPALGPAYTKEPR